MAIGLGVGLSVTISPPKPRYTTALTFAGEPLLLGADVLTFTE